MLYIISVLFLKIESCPECYLTEDMTYYKLIPKKVKYAEAKELCSAESGFRLGIYKTVQQLKNLFLIADIYNTNG